MTADPYNYSNPARPVDSTRYDPYAAPAYGNRSVPSGQPQPQLNEYGGWNTLPAYRPDIASLGSRVAAIVIDVLIVWVFNLIVIGLTGGFSSGDGEVAFASSGLTALLLWVATPVYWIGMEAARGATLGKQLMKIRVVTADGEPIGVGKAIVRYLFLAVDVFAFGLVGILTAKSSPIRQRVGDRVASTIVVRAE